MVEITGGGVSLAPAPVGSGGDASKINNKAKSTPKVYAPDKSKQKFDPKKHAKKLEEDEDESLNNLKRSKKERKYKKIRENSKGEQNSEGANGSKSEGDTNNSHTPSEIIKQVAQSAQAMGPSGGGSSGNSNNGNNNVPNPPPPSASGPANPGGSNPSGGNTGGGTNKFPGGPLNNPNADHVSGKLTLNGVAYSFGSGSSHDYRHIPYGTYPINGLATGPWGRAHGALMINNNAIYDRTLNRTRGGIEIHASASGNTLGCIGVNPAQYPQLKQAILDMIRTQGSAYLTITPEGAYIAPRGQSPPPGAIDAGGGGWDGSGTGGVTGPGQGGVAGSPGAGSYPSTTQGLNVGPNAYGSNNPMSVIMSLAQFLQQEMSSFGSVQSFTNPPPGANPTPYKKGLALDFKITNPTIARSNDAVTFLRNFFGENNIENVYIFNYYLYSNPIETGYIHIEMPEGEPADQALFTFDILTSLNAYLANNNYQ